MKMDQILNTITAHVKNMRPSSIREQIFQHQKEQRKALKNQDMGTYMFYERKIQAGHFLLAMYPAIAVGLGVMAVLAVGVALI